MSDLPEHLDELDQALDALGDDIMTLSELDGLLTAVSVFPNAVGPEEWLPLIWDSEEVDESIIDRPEAADAVARIFARRQEIAAELDRGPGALQPIYPLDSDGSELWEVWLAGFEQGMALRVDAWDAFSRRDDEAADAFALLVTLIFLGEGDEDTQAELGPEKAAKLRAAAAGILPQVVEVLAEAVRTRREPVRSLKIGRNDPCPCGSGKKYKKCCGAA